MNPNGLIHPQISDWGDAHARATEFRWQDQIVGQTRSVAKGTSETVIQVDKLQPRARTLTVQEYVGGTRQAVGILEWGIGGATSRAEFDIRRGVTLPVRASNLRLTVRNEGAEDANYSAHLSDNAGTSTSGGSVPLTRTYSYLPWFEGDFVTVPPFAVAVMPLLSSELPAGPQQFQFRDAAGTTVLQISLDTAERRKPQFIPLPPMVDRVQWSGLNNEDTHILFALLL